MSFCRMKKVTARQLGAWSFERNSPMKLAQSLQQNMMHHLVAGLCSICPCIYWCLSPVLTNLTGWERTVTAWTSASGQLRNQNHINKYWVTPTTWRVTVQKQVSSTKIFGWVEQVIKRVGPQVPPPLCSPWKSG